MFVVDQVQYYVYWCGVVGRGKVVVVDGEQVGVYGYLGEGFLYCCQVFLVYVVIVVVEQVGVGQCLIVGVYCVEVLILVGLGLEESDVFVGDVVLDVDVVVDDYVIYCWGVVGIGVGGDLQVVVGLDLVVVQVQCMLVVEFVF